MSHVHRRGAVTPTMNITPLIDVVFLLIIFFMIVSKISADELPELLVPEMDDPAAKAPGEMSRIVVSILPTLPDVGKRPEGDALQANRTDNNPLNIAGDARAVQVGIRLIPWDRMAEELAPEIEAQLKQNAKLEVMVRADAGVYFRDVQAVLRQVSAAQLPDTELTLNFVMLIEPRL